MVLILMRWLKRFLNDRVLGLLALSLYIFAPKGWMR